jgi:hypothetical protein
LLETLTYPLSRSEVCAELGEVTLLYADGEESLATAVGRTPSDRYESADDLELELFMSLPIDAVGEPGQSEGDA